MIYYDDFCSSNILYVPLSESYADTVAVSI